MQAANAMFARTVSLSNLSADRCALNARWIKNGPTSDPFPQLSPLLYKGSPSILGRTLARVVLSTKSNLDWYIRLYHTLVRFIHHTAYSFWYLLVHAHKVLHDVGKPWPCGDPCNRGVVASVHPAGVFQTDGATTLKGYQKARKSTRRRGERSSTIVFAARDKQVAEQHVGKLVNSRSYYAGITGAALFVPEVFKAVARCTRLPNHFERSMLFAFWSRVWRSYPILQRHENSCPGVQYGVAPGVKRLVAATIKPILRLSCGAVLLDELCNLW